MGLGWGKLYVTIERRPCFFRHTKNSQSAIFTARRKIVTYACKKIGMFSVYRQSCSATATDQTTVSNCSVRAVFLSNTVAIAAAYHILTKLLLNKTDALHFVTGLFYGTL